MLHGPLLPGAVAWPVWAPIARRLAHGTWYADMSPRFRRSDNGRSWDALVMPSARLMQHFMNVPCEGILLAH